MQADPVIFPFVFIYYNVRIAKEKMKPFVKKKPAYPMFTELAEGKDDICIHR